MMRLYLIFVFEQLQTNCKGHPLFYMLRQMIMCLSSTRGTDTWYLKCSIRFDKVSSIYLIITMI